MNFHEFKFISMNFKRKSKAFTLIEVLVSVGIFLLTILAISQIFITVIRSEKLAYALLNSENNIRNNLELMARAMRMGTAFKDNSTDSSQICFTNSNKESQCFIFEENTIKQKLGSDEPQSLMDPNIKVNSGNFYIIDKPNTQKTVIIQFKAEVEVRGQIYPFHIETAVTPRTLNI